MKFEKSDVRPFFIEKNINKLIELSITADDATEILNAVFDLSGEAIS